MEYGEPSEEELKSYTDTAREFKFDLGWLSASKFQEVVYHAVPPVAKATFTTTTSPSYGRRAGSFELYYYFQSRPAKWIFGLQIPRTRTLSSA